MLGLQKIVRWLKSLVGGGEPSPDAPVAEAYECAVCGTPVDGPDAECPLCRSSDIRPASERAAAGDATDGLHGGGPTQVAGGASGPTITEVLGEEGDLLSAYADHWAAEADRYRVSLPDGSETYVDTKDDVRAVLFDAYGTPD